LFDASSIECAYTHYYCTDCGYVSFGLQQATKEQLAMLGVATEQQQAALTHALTYSDPFGGYSSFAEQLVSDDLSTLLQQDTTDVAIFDAICCTFRYDLI
jgi:hypothetical protein